MFEPVYSDFYYCYLFMLEGIIYLCFKELSYMFHVAITALSQGRSQDLVGEGAKNYFFQICALLGGFGGMFGGILPTKF